jgi:hypothetical protein
MEYTGEYVDKAREKGTMLEYYQLKAECDSCNSGMGSVGRIELNLEITLAQGTRIPHSTVSI